ncbi:MAG: prepilin peptidase [Deltaproteobacteria bacterium]|nr:prepilin peptidase [Deltaproteobacteria bacterium]
MGEILSLALGVIWGSFFNVCIVRIPEGQSVVRGRSHCPKCKAPIHWYHNIPLFSYCMLRGRCQACGQPISLQYPLIEAATALIFLWVYHQYGWSLKFLFSAIFISDLLVISVIDFYHQIIPDGLSLGGMAVGFIVSFLGGEVSWVQSLLGILIGGGTFFAVSFLYEKIAKREGLGGGDVKLLAMIGAWLGPQSILFTILISSALGSIVGVSLMIGRKKDLKSAIPFGPFLALAAVIYQRWGEILENLFFQH